MQYVIACTTESTGYIYSYLCMDVEPSRVRKSTIAPPFTKVMSILAGFVLSPAAKQRGVSAKSIVINNE